MFDGIPQALPALARTQALLRRAEQRVSARVDWSGVIKQVQQVVRRLADEQDGTDKGRLVGDFMFEMTALAANAHIDAEGVLRDANARFERRVLESVASSRASEIGDSVLADVSAQN